METIASILSAGWFSHVILSTSIGIDIDREIGMPVTL